MRSPRRVFRAVRTNPPTESDFLSQALIGRRHVDEDAAELASGVSVFATDAQAARTARRYQIGPYIAELTLTEEVEIRRTGRSRGHYTVWAPPSLLLSSVTRVRKME